jgi:putative sterol carrier protein
VGHEFLSDDWINAAKAIRDKYASEITTKPPAIKMNQVITETPSGEDIKMFLDTSSGEMVMDKGELPDADVTITLPYDVAKKQMVDQDQAAAMQAFMSGKVKVQGDMMKLMGMQSMGADPVTGKINDEIKEMTA